MNSGIIGFFDILGYQSLLQNNGSDIAGQVVTKLVALENEMPADMRKSLAPEERDTPKADDLVGLTKWLVFSDTILLYSAFEESDTPGTRTNRWILVNLAAMILWRQMFEYGLPLRGVIHTGEFIVQRSCFAGRAIVAAYNQVRDIDAAICAYSAEASSEVIKQANSIHDSLLWNYIPAQLFEYLLPTKRTEWRKAIVLNPLAITLAKHDDFMRGDIAQLVHESFWKHNKDVAADAVSKLVHTERYLRAARFHLKQLPSPSLGLLRLKGSVTGEARK